MILKATILLTTLCICVGQRKPIDQNLIHNIDSYRKSKLKKTKQINIKSEDFTKAKEKLKKVKSPYQKLSYYVWGLFKTNKKLNLVSEEQINQLKQLVEKSQMQKGRLHDERNYCRIKMLIASYEYALASEKDAPQKREIVLLWLSAWSKFRSDEDAITYSFIKEIWNIFTKDQQQKILDGKWKEATKPLKDYERNFAGDKLLIKALKFKSSEIAGWNQVMSDISSQFSPLRTKYLSSRKLYNKAFVYLDEVPESIALKLSEESYLLLKEMFIFQSDAMRKLMKGILTDDNRKEYEQKLKVYIKKLYSQSLGKYYEKAQGLIDLVEGKP